MSNRILLGPFLCLVLLFAHSLSAQNVAELEARLQTTSAIDEKWKITNSLARNLLTTDPERASKYARDALALALEMKSKDQEAQSAILAADVSWRLNRLKDASTFYAQAREAAFSASMPGLQLEAVEKLQEVAVRQSDYKTAFELNQERTLLLQDKSRRYSEQQEKEREASNAAALEEKSRDTRMLAALLAGFLLVLTGFYYTRQRADRRIRGEMAEKNAMIEEKRRRSEQLLLNILPPAVAAELTVRNKVAARRYERATIMFIDFVGFTKTAELREPETLLAELDFFFS